MTSEIGFTVREIVQARELVCADPFIVGLDRGDRSDARDADIPRTRSRGTPVPPRSAAQVALEEIGSTLPNLEHAGSAGRSGPA